MMAELWSRKREIGEEDESNMEDTSSYDRSGVRLTYVDLENFLSVLLSTGPELVPAVSAMVN
jgi:hypothetical protein